MVRKTSKYCEDQSHCVVMKEGSHPSSICNNSLIPYFVQLPCSKGIK